MNTFDDCLILAGGSGTRLWPASTSRKPKQFLPADANGKESFFLKSVKRALGVISESDSRVIIIAGKFHIPHIVEDCQKLSASEKKRLVLIPEPEAKDTAPAIACAITYVQKTGNQNHSMLVLTSDHMIKPNKPFQLDAGKAESFVEKNNLVLFGITPSRPETGYGYIETAEKLTGNAYSVSAFREKPDRKTAEQFFRDKKYFWNSGMFAFECELLKTEFQRLASDVYGPFEQLKTPDKKAHKKTKGISVLDEWTGLDAAYRRVKNISFDRAIAEKIKQCVMIRAGFNWIDVGSWDEYAALLSNKTSNELFFSGGKNTCFVDSDIPVALAGVEDLVVVIRSGRDGSSPSALIAKKGETQRVKDIVEQIKKVGRDEIL